MVGVHYRIIFQDFQERLYSSNCDLVAYLQKFIVAYLQKNAINYEWMTCNDTTDI